MLTEIFSILKEGCLKGPTKTFMGLNVKFDFPLIANDIDYCQCLVVYMTTTKKKPKLLLF